MPTPSANLPGALRAATLSGLAMPSPLTLWLLVAFAAPLGVVALLRVPKASSAFAPLVPEVSLEYLRYLSGERYYIAIVARRW